MTTQLTEKKSRFSQLKWFFFAIVFFSFPNPVKALTLVNSWRPIFQGVDYATGFTDAPVPQQVNSLRIDLFNPKIQFFSTPDNGNDPEDTTSQTTSQFLDQYDLQVAINANFFAPCCTAAAEPKDLIGLAIAQSDIVSPVDGLIFGGTGEIPESLLITQNNQVDIMTVDGMSNISNVFTSVSGSPRLLVNGAIAVPEIPPNSFADLNPRTAVGLSQNEQYLILMTIDGRQLGISEGATLYQTAEWLQRFGSYQGLNLDGGGSTTMVREGLLGMPQLLNVPSSTGGMERFNGNNFGVFAETIPESGSLYFIASFGLYLVVFRQKR